MSWTDQELSEMAKKAEAGHAFTYQDSFWGEMEALLPAKKKSIWPYFLAIAIPVVGAVALFLNWPTSKLSPEHVAKTATFNGINQLNSRQMASIALNQKVENENRINQESTNNSNVSSLNSKPTNTSDLQNQALAGQVSTRGQKYHVIATEVKDMKLSNENSLKTKISIVEVNNENIAQEPTLPVQNDLLLRSQNDIKEETNVETDKTIDRLPILSLVSTTNYQEIAMLSLPYLSKRRFFSAYGELGFGIGETYAASQIGHVESFSFSGGARLTKNKLFVQAGLGFEVEKAGLELSEREKFYDYGVKTFENRMSYKQVYRLNLPITFGYHIAKHTLQVGATTSYLLSTKMRYAYLVDESVQRNETIYGERKGWNSMGLKMNVGYGFDLFPSTTFGANFQVQLLNQLDKSLTTNENKMPISGQIFIRKTIR